MRCPFGQSGPKCVQRIHDVRCTADGQVEVRLTMESSQPVLSDKYAYSSRAGEKGAILYDRSFLALSDELTRLSIPQLVT